MEQGIKQINHRTVYRDRERPYDEVEMTSSWTYFVTTQPAEWAKNEESREKFVELYGAEALADLDRFGAVPENIEMVWVKRPNGIVYPPVDTSSTLVEDIPAPGVLPPAWAEAMEERIVAKLDLLLSRIP
jgi:hypothetical protein